MQKSQSPQAGRRRRKITKNGTDNATWGWGYSPGHITLNSAKVLPVRKDAQMLITDKGRGVANQLKMLLNTITEYNTELHQRQLKSLRTFNENNTLPHTAYNNKIQHQLCCSSLNSNSTKLLIRLKTALLTSDVTAT